MIIWINGAFGAGKTTIARELLKKLPAAIPFDPEEVGFLLRRFVPGEFQTGDFQDLKLWRSLTVDTCIGLIELTKRPLLVPMTLVNEEYFEEVVGGLRRAGADVHHFALIASRKTLRRRLQFRLSFPQATWWALKQVDRCEQALKSKTFATHIVTDNRTVAEIVDQIIAALPKSSTHTSTT